MSPTERNARAYCASINADADEVAICKARKKLQPLQIRIETIWGRGYSVSAESKAAVLEMAG